MKLNTTKKVVSLLAVAMLVVSASGCSCCKGLFGKKTHTVARPVYTQCAPACSTGCDACSSGNMTTYGMPPVTTFSNPSSINMVPSGY